MAPAYDIPRGTQARQAGGFSAPRPPGLRCEGPARRARRRAAAVQAVLRVAAAPGL